MKKGVLVTERHWGELVPPPCDTEAEREKSRSQRDCPPGKTCNGLLEVSVRYLDDGAKESTFDPAEPKKGKPLHRN